MDFTRFQPADATSSAIKAALIKVNAAIPAHMNHETAAKTARDALLIDGDRKSLEVAETKLRAARDDAERLEAVADQLARRLVAAERQEAVAYVNAALTEVSNANERANAFWKKNGAKLRSLVDEANEIVITRDIAAGRARQARNVAFERFPEAGDQLALGVTGAALDEQVYAEWTELMGRTNPSL